METMTGVIFSAVIPIVMLFIAEYREDRREERARRKRLRTERLQREQLQREMKEFEYCWKLEKEIMSY